jgi:hypothetical protein
MGVVMMRHAFFWVWMTIFSLTNAAFSTEAPDPPIELQLLSERSLSEVPLIDIPIPQKTQAELLAFLRNPRLFYPEDVEELIALVQTEADAQEITDSTYYFHRKTEIVTLLNKEIEKKENRIYEEERRFPRSIFYSFVAATMALGIINAIYWPFDKSGSRAMFIGGMAIDGGFLFSYGMGMVCLYRREMKKFRRNAAREGDPEENTRLLIEDSEDVRMAELEEEHAILRSYVKDKRHHPFVKALYQKEPYTKNQTFYYLFNPPPQETVVEIEK